MFGNPTGKQKLINRKNKTKKLTKFSFQPFNSEKKQENFCIIFLSIQRQNFHDKTYYRSAEQPVI